MPRAWYHFLFLSWFQPYYWPDAFLPAIFMFWFLSIKGPFYLLLNAKSGNIRWAVREKKTKKRYICFPGLKSKPTQRPPDKTKQPENSLQLDTRGGRQGFLEQTPGNSLDSQWGPGYPRVSMDLDPGRLWDVQHLNSERHWESLKTSAKSPLNPLARKSEVKRKGGVILISSLSLALIF